MEIALALLAAVVVLAIGYEFYKKYKANKGNVEQAVLELKEEVVVEVKAVEAKVEVAVAEVKKAAKAAAPKAKTAKKATPKKSDDVAEAAAPVVKKPKIKIVK
jgi:hypothetical protein